MAISVIGVAGSVDAKEWAYLHRRMHDATGFDGVVDGGGVTIGTGTRQVVVAPVEAYQVGTLLMSDAAVTRTYAAPPAAGQSRIDLVCAQVDWSVGDETSAESLAGSIVVVQGTPAVTPAVPRVTRTSGVLWQTPLAQVTVPAAGAPTIVSFKFGAQDTSLLTPLTLPGAWLAVTDTPLAVQKLGGLVEMSGRYTRTTNDMPVGTLAEFNGAAVIPPGFRPPRTAQADAYFGTTGIAKIVITPTGTMSMTIVNATLSADTAFRVVNSQWFAA